MKKDEKMPIIPMAETRGNIIYLYSKKCDKRMGAKWNEEKIVTWIESVDDEVKQIPELFYHISAIGIILSIIAFGIILQSEIFTNAVTIISIITIIVTIATMCVKYRKSPKENPLELKSKHTVEHKIMKFINKYNIIPISKEKLNEASRFTINCGGLDGYSTYENVSATIIGTCTGCIAGIQLTDYIGYFFSGTELIILIIMSILISILIATIIMAFLVCVFTFISEFFTTTKNIEEKDFELGIELAKNYLKWQQEKEPKQ